MESLKYAMDNGVFKLHEYSAKANAFLTLKNKYEASLFDDNTFAMDSLHTIFVTKFPSCFITDGLFCFLRNPENFDDSVTGTSWKRAAEVSGSEFSRCILDCETVLMKLRETKVPLKPHILCIWSLS
jgi:hypothetical protein